MHYTNIFINNFLGPNGYEYLETVKNVILFIIALILLIVLQFVEVTSRYIQKLIIHALITGAISDLFQRWIDSCSGKRRLYIGMTYIKHVKPHKLTHKNNVSIPYKSIQYCDTKNRLIMGAKLNRALLVPRHRLKNYIVVEMDPKFEGKTKGINLINIIDDYEI